MQEVGIRTLLLPKKEMLYKSGVQDTRRRVISREKFCIPRQLLLGTNIPLACHLYTRQTSMILACDYLLRLEGWHHDYI